MTTSLDLHKFTSDSELWMKAPFTASTSEAHWEVATNRYLLVARRVKETSKSKGPPVRILLFVVGLLQQYPKNSVTVSLEQLRQDVGTSQDPGSSVVVAGVPVNHQVLERLLEELPGERARVWKFQVTGDEPCLVLDAPTGEWRSFLMGLDRAVSKADVVKLDPEGDQDEPKEKVGPYESDDLDIDEVFNQWC